MLRVDTPTNRYWSEGGALIRCVVGLKDSRRTSTTATEQAAPNHRPVPADYARVTKQKSREPLQKSSNRDTMELTHIDKEHVSHL